MLYLVNGVLKIQLTLKLAALASKKYRMALVSGSENGPEPA